MTATTDAFAALPAIENHRPWPRRVVDQAHVARAGRPVGGRRIHSARPLGRRRHGPYGLARPAGNCRPSVASFACAEGFFPSVSRLHPPAIRLERTIRDLFGLDGRRRRRRSALARPWALAGDGAAGRPESRAGDAAAYQFLPSVGEGLHQIPVGPVHAGIIEPGHFRFTAAGETVVRLEERLGYAHKGVERLMAGRKPRARGKNWRRASPATARSPVRSPSPAPSRPRWQVEPPPRAIWLRALMAELERVANHLGDIGAVCNDAAFAIMLAHCSVLRENVLRACETCFGHRLMMDVIVPGGMGVDFPASGAICHPRPRGRRPQGLSATGRALRQYRLPAGPHRRNRHLLRRWRRNSAAAALSAALRDGLSTRAAISPMLPTTS